MGEFGPTLEDPSALLRWNMLGKIDFQSYTLKDEEDKDLHDAEGEIQPSV